MTNCPPLTPPHDYANYKTTGPWMTTFVFDDGSVKSWVMRDRKTALARFCYFADEKRPVWRILVDAFGVTVLGIDGTAVANIGAPQVVGESFGPHVVATEEMCDAMLALVDSQPLEAQFQVLDLVDKIKQGKGVMERWAQ